MNQPRLTGFRLYPFLIVSFLAVSLLSAHQLPTEPPATGLTVERFSRNAVTAFWHRYYLPDQQEYIAAYGAQTDLTDQQIPETSDNFNRMVQRRVNFYRALCGLPGDIDFSETEITRRPDDPFDPPAGSTSRDACREAAYWVAQNRTANHLPELLENSNWPVNSLNRNGAANSNLALGFAGPGAIDQYLYEPPGEGDSVVGIEPDPLFNRKVGHRRAILFSRAARMATGDVISTPLNHQGNLEIRLANSLYVIGNFREQQEPTFIAWPNDGFCPVDLSPNFWSLSRSKAVFENATVTMIGPDGENIPITVVSRSLGMGVVDEPSDIPANGAPIGSPRTLGDSTIVWQPAPGTIADAKSAAFEDKTYIVTVSNIEGGGPTSFTYAVTLFNPNRLDEELSLVGSTAPPVEGAAYAFEPVAGAEGYDFEVVVPGPTDWEEGGEDGDFLIQSPKVFSTDLVRPTTQPKTGARSLVLSFGSPDDIPLFDHQSIIIDRPFVPELGGAIEFSYFFGFVANTSTVALEVSNDGGVNWQEVWSRLGDNGASRSGTYLEESVSLEAFLGQTLTMRFVIRKSTPSTASFYYGYDPGVSFFPFVGASFDDIRVVNAFGPNMRRVTKLPANALRGTFDSTSAGLALVPGQTYELRARAILGGFALAWGPTLEVIPTVKTIANTWADYVAFTAPTVEDFHGDRDQDGVANGLEFALGRDALNASEEPIPQSASVDGGDLCLSLPLDHPLPPEIILGAEFSENGIDWTSDGASVEVENSRLKARVPTNGLRILFLRWTADLD